MYKCSKCGKTVLENTKFCSHCGKKIVMNKEDKSIKIPVPKKFYYVFLGFFVIVIITHLVVYTIGEIFPSYDKWCSDSSGNTYECNLPRNSTAEFMYRLNNWGGMVGFLLSILAIIYVIAKRYRFKALILPITTILVFLLGFTFIGGITTVTNSGIFFIYSFIGSGIALFFIWRE